jgi:trans-aconitate methyltransferase
MIVLALLLVTNTTLASAPTQQWSGAQYDQNSAPQYGTARRLLAELNLKEFHSIADLGCGSGSISHYISQNSSAKVIGVDAAVDMIEFATKNYSAPNLSFYVMDLTNWHLPKNHFDLMVSFNVLHWVEDLGAVFKNVADCLQENGMFMLATAHKNHFLYTSILQVATHDAWRNYYQNPEQQPWFGQSIESMSLLLKEAGLEPIDVHVWHKTLSFKNRTSFINFLKEWMGAVPQVFQLPQELRADFITTVADNFLQTITIKEDGSFEFITPILIATARKK